MSTRATINFGHGRPTDEGRYLVAKVYRHSDGYPDGEHGVPGSFDRFHDAVRRETEGTRENDPSYYAAKYVVWQAGDYAEVAAGFKHTGRKADPENEHQGSLCFLGVGIVKDDPADIEHTYWYDADRRHLWHRAVWGHEPRGNWQRVRNYAAEGAEAAPAQPVGDPS